MILVTGATGRAGSQVVRALQERGCEVRAVVRVPVRARELLGENVELAVRCVLSGPDAITDEQIAAALSVAAADRVEFIPISDAEAREALIGPGLPGFLAEQFVATLAQARAGAAAQVTPSAEALTGTPPRHFADFAREHARAFSNSELAA
jgi:uncharacterized protein YbjT (DUF2867 family)